MPVRQAMWDWLTKPATPPAPSETPRALTAAATTEDTGRARLYLQPESWQTEAWDNYDNLEEYGYAVDWLAGACSRVRIRAARLVPGQDEPEIVDEGPAAELVAELGGVGGHAELLTRFATLLSVPGEGWLLGETRDGVTTWTVRSVDEIRSRGTGTLEVLDELASRPGHEVWREVAANHLIGRIWRPHPRLHHLATSPARGARKAMRELELVNRHITAQYLSRLASAGLLLIPDELTFPVRPEFEDAPDPFMAELVETARTAIATPGTAAAIVPIPLRVPGEWLEKVKHIDFTLKLDEKIIEKRDSAIRRLATKVDLPAEILLGVGGMNHWGAAQIEESAVKLHVSPIVELIVAGLTRVYLHPRLKAAGLDPAEWAIWYDASELTVRPDRSGNATEGYDRMELSGEAWRRENGFDESDRPGGDELAEMLLKYAARQPATALAAISELTGSPVVSGAPAEPDDSGEGKDPPTEEEKVGTAPDTRDDPEPRKDRRRPATAASVAKHRLVIEVDGAWRVLHPRSCGLRAAECWVTWAAHKHDGVTPGQTGQYRLRLGPYGLELGDRTFDLDVSAISSRVK